MGLKVFTISFSEIRRDLYLRDDEKYHSFLFSSDWNLFNIKNKKLVPLKDILLDDYNLFDYQNNEKYKGIPTGQTYLDEDGDIIDFQLVTYDDHPGRLKYRITNSNILLSSLRLAKTPALYFENQDLSKYVFSNGFYIFSVRSNWNKKFILYILRTKKIKNILNNYIYRGIGISAYKKKDLLKIKIPSVHKTKQNQIVTQIEPIEISINKLKSQVKQPQDIINKIFARKFGFDLEKYKKIKENTFFNTSLSDIKTSLIRSTAIQNKPSTRFLKTFLSHNTIFLKDLLLKPIKRGKQPIYTNDGIKVIKTLNIQNGKINYDDVQFVSEKYLETNKEKAGIYKNDLLLTSTGMGRGKFALYADEDICFADSHISIIRFNYEKIIPYFLNYYCQSFFGTEQLKYIEIHIKGTPEIYENQLNYFQIPSVSLEKQQSIIDEIKAELDKQEEIKKQIEIERNRIDKIIENAVN